MLKAACRICKKFSENRQLVRSGGAECFPDNVRDVLESRFPDCQDLPSAKSKNIKSIVVMKSDPGRDYTRVQWFAMAFSSVNIVNENNVNLFRCRKIYYRIYIEYKT